MTGSTVELCIAGATLVPAAAGASMLWWRTAHPPHVGYARTGQLAELLPGRVGTAKARRLRPSLRGQLIRSCPHP